MTAQPKAYMTVDEFLLWAEEQTGRYELVGGVVHAMAAERVAHAVVKHRAAVALEAAIAKANCRCWVLPDGMTVRVDHETAYEPDALVYCGAQLPDDALEVREPMILVEVLSPSTKKIDASAKLSDYFRIPSVQHYLIINPGRPPMVHHQRGPDGLIATRLVPADAQLRLDPPGLTLDVAPIFAVG